MANAVLQMRMAYGSSGFPTFPANPLAIYVPEYNPSVQNSSGAACDFYEGIYQIKDLSGNGYHGVQTTPANQPKYLKWSGENFFWNPGGTNGAKIVWAGASVGSNPVITDFQITMKLSAVSWASGAIQYLVFKAGYLALWLTATGTVSVHRVGAGGAVHDSTAAVPFASNDIRWIRVTYVNNTGSGNYSVVFETSSDGTTWSALGSTLTGASEANMGAVVADLSASGQAGNTLAFTGRVFSLVIQDTTNAVARVSWNTAASTHLADTGTSAAGGNATYSSAGTISRRGALIGRGVIATISGTTYFNTPVIPTTANWHQLCKVIGCADGWQSLTTQGGTFIGAIANGTNVFTCGPNGRGDTAINTIQRNYTNLAQEINGTSPRLVINGVSSGQAYTASVQAGTLDRIYGANPGPNMFGRLGIWTYANRPSDAAGNTWLT